MPLSRFALVMIFGGRRAILLKMEIISAIDVGCSEAMILMRTPGWLVTRKVASDGSGRIVGSDVIANCVEWHINIYGLVAQYAACNMRQKPLLLPDRVTRSVKCGYASEQRGYPIVSKHK